MDYQLKDTEDKTNSDVSSTLLKQTTPSTKVPTIGKRHVQIILVTMITFSSTFIKSALSVAIVAMTDPTVNSNKNIPTYNWTDKSLVMASYIYGYSIPQIAAGYLATIYGGKWFIVGSTTFAAVAGLLTPSAATLFGSRGVMLCRFLQGLSSGFLFPCVNDILGKWIPSTERSRLGNLVFTGSSVGGVSSMLLTGYISASRYGWPMVFYTFNATTLVICVLYSYIGRSDPSSHPTISKAEKEFIERNLSSRRREELRIPWREILTSKGFWALVATNLPFNFTYWLIISEISIYLNKVMNFDLASNSIVSGLPYFIEVFFSIIFSFTADFLTLNKVLSTTIIRKIMNNIGLLVPAICLFLLGRTGPENSTLAVILLISAVSGQAAGKSGFIVNHMDLAPNFAGILMGISNGLSVMFSTLAPTLTQFLVTDETNIGQWRNIFHITMGMNIVSAFFNTCFTTGKRQVWNENSKNKEGSANTVKLPPTYECVG